ncbi:MAG TPA: hypothetical protein VMW42_08285, partial [Desulfatiglandales bacterium]|nr:hypothetical protein [Desulfatiglandales bacterium]
ESHQIVRQIVRAFGIDSVEINGSGVVPGHNYALLTKTVVHRYSPYDRTIFLDADTVVVGSIDELFDMLDFDDVVFTRFCDWSSSRNPVAGRIKEWSSIFPELIGSALSFGPAINSGVFAFSRSEYAVGMLETWARMAVPGRKFFICDEVCLQLVVPMFDCGVVDSVFNTSCKYGRLTPDTRVIHYHGKKHCRCGSPVPFMGDVWVSFFDEVMSKDIASVSAWCPAGDRQLGKFLKWRFK